MKSELTITPKGDTINILEGKALEPKHPNKLKISGQIDSVNKYLAARRGTLQPSGALQHIDRDLAVITVDEEAMTIHLDVDPNHAFGTEVVGKLEMNPDLVPFGINKTVEFTREKLIHLLRFSRRFFTLPAHHEALITAYQKLNISGNTNLKVETDTRGNKDMGFKKTIDSSSIPTEFVLEMPVFKGQPARKFRVEICLEASDASVRFWFESVELIEIIEKDKKEIFQAQLADYLEYAIIWK